MEGLCGRRQADMARSIDLFLPLRHGLKIPITWNNVSLVNGLDLNVLAFFLAITNGAQLELLESVVEVDLGFSRADFARHRPGSALLIINLEHKPKTEYVSYVYAAGPPRLRSTHFCAVKTRKLLYYKSRTVNWKGPAPGAWLEVMKRGYFVDVLEV